MSGRSSRSTNPGVALLAALGLVLMASAGSAPAFAKKKEPPPSGPKDEKKDEDSPFKEWDKTLKDVETSKGLFAIHKKHDNLWLEIAPEQLDKPFMMISSVASGLGKGWLLGGMPLDTDLWAFHRAGTKIQIKIKNTRFRASAGEEMAKAVELSYGDSVLASAKIVSVQKDTNHLLIDLNDIIVSDLPGISLALKQFLGGPASFDKDRSAVARYKTFPKNVEIEVAATYVSAEAKPLDTVSDPRYLPVGLHYSLSELPEDDFKPRIADDRIGYFLTVSKDFSNDSSDSFFVRYANRWKLEKQDPTASLSVPKEPIVYYLDRTIPKEYRAYVREGILMWNKAFEKAGFRDAMVVKDAPEDPDFDPEDVRYNTIRWITSSEPSFGAIGPSRVDPRSGHILDADILVEAAMVQNVRRGYRNYVNTLSTSSAPPAWWSAIGGANGASCSFAEGVELGATVDATAFLAAGEMQPGGTVPEEYIGQFLHWVISHEVGHTLGLRHNFRASAATPNEKLNNVSWTREHGLYDSVMEYPAPNFSADRRTQGDYYSQSVGDYDLWAIEWGYTPVDAKAPEDEITTLRKIAALSTMPGHEYGSDDDAFAGPVPVGVDPAVNQFDLGSDPIAYGRERLALIQGVRGKIKDKLIARGEGYERLRNTFDGLLLAQSQVLQIVSKQIGGLSTSRSHRGDPGERAPFTPVSPARQREAMAILASSGLSEPAWSVSPELLNALQASHWQHWGSDFANMIPLDYPFTQKVLDIQSGLLDRMYHPILLARVLETEEKARKGEAYTLAEHMKALNDAVFTELGAPRPGGAGGGAAAQPGGFAISGMRRNLGRASIERQIGILNTPADGTPEDARSLARANLTSLEKRMGSVLTTRSAGMDESTKAYLEESKARIRRALDALSVLMAGGPRRPGGNAAANVGGEGSTGR